MLAARCLVRRNGRGRGRLLGALGGGESSVGLTKAARISARRASLMAGDARDDLCAAKDRPARSYRRGTGSTCSKSSSPEEKVARL